MDTILKTFTIKHFKSVHKSHYQMQTLYKNMQNSISYNTSLCRLLPLLYKSMNEMDLLTFKFYNLF